jgi:hypothetical protein
MHITLEQGNHHILEPCPHEMQVQDNHMYLTNKEKNIFWKIVFTPVIFKVNNH